MGEKDERGLFLMILALFSRQREKKTMEGKII